MARNTRQFSDIDLNFIAHPITGDINIRYDEDAIKQSVKNLVLTHNYERPFHSDIGSPVHGLLFELTSPLLAITLKKVISDLIFNHEPRVNLIDVIINLKPDNNSIDISIYFTILNTSKPITLDITLERTR
ncbi:COG3628 Phage baseplate assembly protein W [uncultured Caudovirales phage]|uniref:COG3628 Phage baseplate assembly protein W n=1 Tax=uncultured Caudovirales phage TaxID=2100421 RepID=A0A6J5L413_9CAUD|nr:COG3628 Phage baseplate assembly protein W [uncultured Caudovirales phage]